VTPGQDTSAAPQPVTVEALEWLAEKALAEFRRITALEARIDKAGLRGDAKAVVEAEDRLLDSLHAWVSDGGPERWAHCDTMWVALNPDTYWTADNSVSRAEVSKLLAALIGSVRPSKYADPKMFVSCLLDDVVAAAPTYPGLYTTCRRIRRTRDFMPSIAQFLATLKEEEARWLELYDHWEFAAHYVKMRDRLLQAQAQRATDAGEAAVAYAEVEF